MTSTPFLGRADETRLLRALINGARNQIAGSVVVHGEPGIGKSALLSRAAADLVGVRVLWLSGFEVESRLAYGALQRLSRLLDTQIDDLPTRQRQAMRVAIGLEDGPPPERVLVGLQLRPNRPSKG